MTNNIPSLTTTFINDCKHLNASFNLAFETKAHLEARDEWNLEDWFRLLATGCYVGFSAYNAYQDGIQLYNAVVERQSVTNKVAASQIPANIYLNSSVKTKPVFILRKIKN